MKYTSLILKLILSVFMVTSYSYVEAAGTKKSSSSKAKTKTSSKSSKSSKSKSRKMGPEEPSAAARRDALSKRQSGSEAKSGEKCAATGELVDDAKLKCDVEKGTFQYGDCTCWPGEKQNDILTQLPELRVNGSNTCAANFQKMLEQCERDVDSAKNRCDKDQDSGIRSTQSQLSDFAVEASKLVAIQAPCAGYAKHVGAVNGAVATFAGICNSSRDTCMNSCRKIVNAIKKADPTSCGMEVYAYTRMDQQAKEQMNQCDQFITEVTRAQDAVQNIIGSVQAAQQCAKQANAQPADYCKANPTALGCEVAAAECANPAFAAQNPICFCKGPDALTNPKCRVMQKAANGDQGAFMPTLAGGSGGGAGGDKDPVFGAEHEQWQGDPNYKKSTEAGADPGGKKGGRPFDGGGSGKGGGGGGDTAGAGGEPVPGPQINNGFRGGSGGGMGGSMGSYDSEGSGGGGYGADEASDEASAGPDLRQFLPGGKFDPGSRGVAGMTGPDGITGPHDSLFRKVKNRYQAQQPTFLGQ